MLWFAAAKSAALAYCRPLPDEITPRGEGTGTSPMGTPQRKRKRLRVCREHHRPDNKCMAYAAPGSDRCALHHLEAFTHRRRRLCGCGAQPDPGYRTCAWCRVWSSWRKKCKRHPELELSARTQQFVRGYLEHGNAARAARAAEFGTGPGARRVGYKLLRKPYIRAAIEEMKAAILNHAHQRAEDDARAAALTRDVELDRLARVELTALLDLEDAERKQKLLMRLHDEVMAGGRYREGSQGGAQSRFARVCRQWRGEPAHREPGRCCCGKLATSPRGASCDYCRERNRHYRRRYRAKVRARGSISRTA